MSKIVKLVGILFLPVAVIIFIFAFLGGRAGEKGKDLFLQEYDEQNIYG